MRSASAAAWGDEGFSTTAGWSGAGFSVERLVDALERLRFAACRSGWQSG